MKPLTLSQLISNHRAPQRHQASFSSPQHAAQPAHAGAVNREEAGAEGVSALSPAPSVILLKDTK